MACFVLCRCPECKESFVTTVKLHTHAVNCHYYAQLKTLLQPQYKMTRGFCGECQKPTASLQSFMYHMGVKHKVVLAVSLFGLHSIRNKTHLVEKTTLVETELKVWSRVQ